MRRVVLGLAALLAVSLVLRSTALHAHYWIDEGLSVGIARFDLLDIPGALRQDGSPPLYYLLLGVWTRIFGDGEAHTHVLSLGFALLTVPAAFALARALFDERTAWFAAGVAALLPFLTYYAQETRMYALEALLSLLVCGLFALVYLQGRRRLLPLFVLAGAALLYTHNWGLFLLAATGVALLALTRGRVPWRDALLGYGAIALLYLPWLPTLLYQAGHTGAPWSERPTPGDVPSALAEVLGGEGAAVAILLVAGAGALALARGPGRRVQARTASGLGIILLVALVLAFAASQVSPAWTMRYFAALAGPLILLIAAGLARAGGLGVATAVVLAALWLQPPTERLEGKSNAYAVGARVEGLVGPGDLVVATHPEQVPVAALYFPDGLRWANAMGERADTRIFDWRDALERYRTAAPRPTSDRAVRSLRPGQRLALLQPLLRSASWNAPWTRLVRRRSVQWERLLDRDGRLERLASLPHVGTGPVPRGIRVVVYRRRPAR